MDPPVPDWARPGFSGETPPGTGCPLHFGASVEVQILPARGFFLAETSPKSSSGIRSEGQTITPKRELI